MRASQSIAIHSLLVLGSLLVGFILLEAAAQVYVATIGKQGKLFTPDPELGWVLLPDLERTRKNANGDLWHVSTGPRRVRGPAEWRREAVTRVLVLGDSFAFGEGVDFEDRFDTLVMAQQPDWSIVNLGVMGYGPDQQLIRARRWSNQLRTGDVLLLLTYDGNDFHDLARTRHGGRSKPWLEDRGDLLVEHPPAIGVFDHLRDRSFLFAKLAREVMTRRGASAQTEARLTASGELYRKLVLQEAAPLLARGVRVIIAHHGTGVRPLPFDPSDVYDEVCPQVTGCVALDPALAAHPRAQIFLDDGHWAPGGHRVAAEQIGTYLRRLPSNGMESAAGAV